MVQTKKIILLAEDDEADVTFLKRALKMIKSDFELHVTRDGLETLDYIQNEESSAYIKPDLILLDINMPKMSGKEVLKVIKKDERTSSIPVIMLTTSGAKNDVNQSYAYGANCYLQKPHTLNELMDLAKAIEKFWFEVSVLPP